MATTVNPKKLQILLNKYSEIKLDDWISENDFEEIVYCFVYRQWQVHSIAVDYSLLAVYSTLMMFMHRQRAGLLRKGFEFEVELKENLDLL